MPTPPEALSDFEMDEATSQATLSAMPVAIEPDAMTTNSLKALQSDDQRKVMDIVDKLRRTGLSGIVELPQLVVSMLILVNLAIANIVLRSVVISRQARVPC